MRRSPKPSPSGPHHEWSTRVYYEDTDAGGVVYHARYLHFMERGRTEWLRSLGFQQHRLEQELGLVFAVRSVQVDYLRPAVLDDSLTVRSSILEPRRASLIFQQGIFRDGQLLCQGTVKVASLDSESFAPRPIPDIILQATIAGVPTP